MNKSHIKEEFYRNVWCLLGLPFDAINMESTLNIVHQSVNKKSPCFISTPNINFVIASQSDRAFRDSVICSDLSIADGMPIIWIARLLGFPLKERVSGSGLIENLQEKIFEYSCPINVYLFGGEEGVAGHACEQLNLETGNLKCVGSYFPGFGNVIDMSGDEIIKKINRNNPDFVIVSLGAKKGQAWIMENREKINAPIISHLGAVVNFISGTVKRAPNWMQISGLEWFWRILQEPSLWYRYTSDGFALFRLFVTRVCPYKLFLLFRNKKLDDIEVDIKIKENEQSMEIILKGSLTMNNLTPIREVFANISVINKNIKLDLSKVVYLDASFIGLLMVLYKYVISQNNQFNVTSVSKYIRRIFNYNEACFLLNE